MSKTQLREGKFWCSSFIEIWLGNIFRFAARKLYSCKKNSSNNNDNNSQEIIKKKFTDLVSRNKTNFWVNNSKIDVKFDR